MLPFGPTTIRRVGIVSGGTSSLFDLPEVSGLDLLITGEPRQSNFHDAAEHKLNLLFIGHYSSETVGVRAVGDHLAAKFGVQHEFIDVPTGI
jgi:putative NIF3 family GTP cyclohydrolase 1 type 2